ncbi:MAG: pyridoxamine 5'-phosphate oxidase family protein [Rhodobacteraceae bacterium]|nr:pyridoxamine 5'-phosphate oxidase family protein [Paracoccaceae bacterium]
MQSYGDLMFTPNVRAGQEAEGSAEAFGTRYAKAPDGLGPDEIAFLQSRTSVYMSTISETGWPYIQHRGGPRGFLKVVSPTQFGFADYRGNRQLVSQGHLVGNAKTSFFAMDYPQKARLKLQGHARMMPADSNPELAEKLHTEGQGRVERLVLVDVEAFDWNCPQFITLRMDQAELAAVVGPEFDRLEARIRALEARIRALEAENAALRNAKG